MDVTEIRSSSNELSSAPNSDVEGPYPVSHSNTDSGAIAVHNHNGATSTTFGPVGSNTPGAGRQDPAPAKRKRRTKKELEEAAALKAEKKAKAARKPRAAPGTAASRKKLKIEGGAAESTVQSIPHTPDLGAARINQPLPLAAATTPTTGEAAKYSQNGFSNTASSMSSQTPTPYNAIFQSQPQSQPHLPPPKARAMFDPVRGHTTERTHDISQPSTSAVPSQFSTPPRLPYFPTASPSLSSIMNPTDNSRNDSRPSTALRPESDTPAKTFTTTTFKPENNTAMELDQPVVQQEKKAAPETTPIAKPVTKPRAKEQPPPLPTGSGLLSSSLFGGDSGMDSKQENGEKGPNIVLHVDLKDPNNKVINFARMAEEKYGFAALYPRQAAQKERLAKVAAAGAALERSALSNKGGTSAGDSGDEEASVDIDRDSDNDGDVNMSGVNGQGEVVNSGTDGPGPKRRKRKDEYDADDPFVDDSEMLWEAQAAASKDGFFVYCGPLVPEGEKPAVERADGTVKRGRGRGRGGGPGSRGGRGAAAAAMRDVDGGSNKTNGPGSRGGGITRKPRITKAERLMREQEKKSREQTAVIAAKPTTLQT